MNAADLAPDPVADLRQSLAPLLAQAREALASRTQLYPALVAAGRLEQSAAADDLRIWGAIVADWTCYVTGTGDRGTTASIAEKVAALDESIRRYDAALDKALASTSENIRSDCTQISDAASLTDRYGDAVAPIIGMRAQRDRIRDLRATYWSLHPATTYYWRGLFRGVDAWLTYCRTARAERAGQGRAAA